MQRSPKAWLSCIICAYNEAQRIGPILNVVAGHRLFAEIIVIDDGSTDDTAARVRACPGVSLISYRPNRGKTYALARGIAAARCDHLMLLDADLAGIGPQDIEALAAPVLAGAAEVSISLRRNSLGLYRLLGLDFLSGERVLPRALLRGAAEAMTQLPRWGSEVFINERIIDQGLRVAVVDWRCVSHTPKRLKVGALQGAIEEFGMMGDTLRVLTPVGLVRQNMALLKLLR